MKYSIIIPTYNHCDDLLKPCIDSILKYTDMTEVELIVSANGCTDNTLWYLKSLAYQFNSIGFGNHFKIIWSDKPLGYAKANNVALQHATGEKIILANNDIVLLDQQKNTWLNKLTDKFNDPTCGIAYINKGLFEATQEIFAVFFLVMIDRKVFEKIGILNEEYGAGGGEDIEFSLNAVRAGFTLHQADEQVWDSQTHLWLGDYPVYHKGEGTVHDESLVHDYHTTFNDNMLRVARKFNPDWYRWKVSNNYERAVFLKGDEVFPREKRRYQWAAEHFYGKKVLEIGCSTGFGIQFLPEDIDYTGLDYDRGSIKIAQGEKWREGTKYVNEDINKFELEQYDTIIAFEIIEHIPNGIEMIDKLRKHCKRLLVTVPYKEPPGFWGEHHVLHNLDETMFPDAERWFIDEHGNLSDNTDTGSQFYLMVMKYEQ